MIKFNKQKRKIRSCIFMMMTLNFFLLVFLNKTKNYHNDLFSNKYINILIKKDFYKNYFIYKINELRDILKDLFKNIIKFKLLVIEKWNNKNMKILFRYYDFE